MRLEKLDLILLDKHMITIKHKGDFKNTERFLKRSQSLKVRAILEKYGQEGVSALALATPVDTGLTASSWEYKIKITRSGYILVWSNTNVVNNLQVAILIQYGHGTKSGTFVQGIDYVNPAIRPILNKMSESIWKEVTNL